MTTEIRGDSASVESPAAQALRRATDHVLSLQSPQGWWKGELETNVTMDAEDLLMREFLNIRTEEETAQAARWIRSQQGENGAWAVFYGGPPDLSTTIEAYLALRLAGDSPQDEHMAQAASFVRTAGGLERSRVFTRIWFALFGLWSWDRLPALPPEMIFLPRWFPLNVYDFASWARQTIVPLTIVSSARPVHRLSFSAPELRTGTATTGRRQAAPTRWGRFFHALDRGLHAYESRPAAPLRSVALRRAAEWIIARQEADGCWGGIQPPWVYSLIALHLIGYDLDHPVMRAGLQGLEGFTIVEDTPRGTVRRFEACQSPVWDTALTVTALADAGVPADDPALVRAGEWLAGEEVRRRGDWAVHRPHLEPGGWAFEFDNDNYPDTDDTAEVVLALRRVDHGQRGADVESRVQRALTWLTGMQSKDGGWGAFDVDNTSRMPAELPFCDFGNVTDPPSADVTAHAVEVLCAEGRRAGAAVRRGVDWLLAAQEPDGSWFGRWGANYVAGTGAVVPALVAAGLSLQHPAITRAVAWLTDRQNPDGGWGEDLRSYDDPQTWAGRGHSTPSQTAWALLALHAAGKRDYVAATRGVDYLCGTQNPDGTWDQPYFTGTGFPGDFYINYHLYRLVFPLSALGRYLGDR